MVRNTVMNYWPEQRCGGLCDVRLLLAKTRFRSTHDSHLHRELQFCLKEVSQNVMKIVMAPFTAVLGKQAGVTNVFMQVLNSIKTAIKRMYDEFLSFMDTFFKKFNAIANQIGIVTQKLKMAFQRLNAALLSVVFSGLSIVKGINNTVKFVVKVVLIILAIMVALIILLFFVLFPFIPLIITPVILAIISAAPLIGYDAAAEAAGDQGAFCFTGDTPILLADGNNETYERPCSRNETCQFWDGGGHSDNGRRSHTPVCASRNPRIRLASRKGRTGMAFRCRRCPC